MSRKVKNEKYKKDVDVQNKGDSAIITNVPDNSKLGRFLNSILG